MAAACAGHRTVRPRNVLVLCVDALRADHVGTYGYERPTTPVIDTLAERGATFEFALAASNWTVPAVASLFTSRYPSEHGATLAGEVKNLDVQTPAELRPGIETAAEILRRRGFQTAFFSANPFLRASLTRGFGAVRTETRQADGLVDDVVAWLRNAGSAPFFAYVHFMDLHQPIRVPEPFFGLFPADQGGERLAKHGEWGGYGRRTNLDDPRFLAFRSHRIAVYDGAIRFVDTEVHRLLSALDSASRLGDTLVIVTADHGEELWDHANEERAQGADPRGYAGIGHGHSMYQEVLRVPLIVAGPGVQAGRRIACPTNHLDVVPTLLDLLGIAPPPGLRGASRCALLRRGAVPEDCVRAPLFAESPAYGPATRVVVEGSLKLIARSGAPPLLFDLSSDPGERTDLAAARPEAVAALAKRLADTLPFEVADRPVSRLALDAETRERLRSLGYLSPGAPDR
jgi:arylsulfatase A-like enzyme